MGTYDLPIIKKGRRLEQRRPQAPGLGLPATGSPATSQCLLCRGGCCLSYWCLFWSRGVLSVSFCGVVLVVLLFSCFCFWLVSFRVVQGTGRRCHLFRRGTRKVEASHLSRRGPFNPRSPWCIVGIYWFWIGLLPRGFSLPFDLCYKVCAPSPQMMHTG